MSHTRLERFLPLGALLLLPAAGPLLGSSGLFGSRNVLPAHAPASDLQDRPLAGLVPDRTIFFAEAPGLGELADQGLGHPFVRGVLDAGLGEVLAEQGSSPEELLGAADAALGMPLLATVADATSDGAAVALGLGPGGVTFTALLRARSAEDMGGVLDATFARLEEVYDAGGAFAEPHDVIASASVWHLDEELHVAHLGSLAVVSNSERWLRQSLELASGERDDARSLLARDDVARLSAAGAPPLAWAWLDAEKIEFLQREFGNGDDGGLPKVRALMETPAVHFLLGSSVAALAGASSYTLELDLDDTSLAFTLGGTGVGEFPELRPHAGGPAPPALAPHPEDVARAFVYRDSAGVFRQRVDLFPADTLPRFSKASSDLALFFGGKDLGEEVLPALAPWSRWIVRHPRFDAQATPEIPLPAAAVLLKLTEPDRGPELVSAFQTMISVVNLDRAQEGSSPMLMELEPVAGVTLTKAHHPAPAPGEGVDMSYNLVPACALFGDVLVLGTHDSLVRDIVLELSAAQPDTGTSSPPGSPRGEHLWIDGAMTARILRENFEALVAQNILEEGNTPEEARGEIGALVQIVEAIDALDLTVIDPGGEDTVALRLDLSLAPGR